MCALLGIHMWRCGHDRQKCTPLMKSDAWSRLGLFSDANNEVGSHRRAYHRSAEADGCYRWAVAIMNQWLEGSRERPTPADLRRLVASHNEARPQDKPLVSACECNQGKKSTLR